MRCCAGALIELDQHLVAAMRGERRVGTGTLEDPKAEDVGIVSQ
jgi:hypothetical protein